MIYGEVIDIIQKDTLFNRKSYLNFIDDIIESKGWQ